MKVNVLFHLSWSDSTNGNVQMFLFVCLVFFLNPELFHEFGCCDSLVPESIWLKGDTD